MVEARVSWDRMSDTVELRCPYCFEQVEIYIDPENEGELIHDCDVCCRPWALHVAHDSNGDPVVQVSRSQ